MNVNQIIDDILQREQPGKPPTYLSPNDAGGRTHYGISERAHPEAWRNGPPTMDQVRAIYLQVYVKPFFPLAAVAGTDPLIDVLVDDAVMSGVVTAVKQLQSVLGIQADGVIGKDTLAAVKIMPQKKLLQHYVIERLLRITRLVEARPSDLTNLTGWARRVLTFLPEAA